MTENDLIRRKGNSKMTAKEMFEELGYEFYDYHFLDVPKSQNVMIPQDEPKLIYTERSERGEECIEFRGYAKCVDVSAVAYENGKRYRMPAPLNYKEIKAIMKQFEELGWNK